jgi:hypothetical protein
MLSAISFCHGFHCAFWKRCYPFALLQLICKKKDVCVGRRLLKKLSAISRFPVALWGDMIWVAGSAATSFSAACALYLPRDVLSSLSCVREDFSGRDRAADCSLGPGRVE